MAEQLKRDYIVILVDVNKGRNAATAQPYGHPTQFGLPTLAVLGGNGKPLTVQDSGKLEQGDHHDPQKVLAFLRQWAPKKNSG